MKTGSVWSNERKKEPIQRDEAVVGAKRNENQTYHDFEAYFTW